MPQFFTGFIGSLRVTYDAIEAGDLYSYNTLALQDDVEDGSQLAVVWKCQSVTRTSDSAVIFPSFDLSTVEAEQIYLLDSSLYSVNSTSKEVTLTSASVENSLVTVGGVEYRRGPLTGNVSADFPIIIERATDIAAPIVTYQPGSRLSHTTLNASSDQTIYALQELQLELLDLQAITGDVDLANASIGELGDVTITDLTTTPETMYWDGSGWINATFAEADIAKSSEVSYLGHTHVASDITNFSQATTTVISGTSINALVDVSTAGVTNDNFLRWNGLGWVPEDTTGADIFWDSGKTATIENAISGLGVDLITLDGEAVKYADSIDALADVDTTTTPPVLDDLLKFDGANWIPFAAPALAGLGVKQIVAFSQAGVHSSTNTTNWITSGMTATITPTSASSKILLMGIANVRCDATTPNTTQLIGSQLRLETGNVAATGNTSTGSGVSNSTGSSIQVQGRVATYPSSTANASIVQTPVFALFDSPGTSATRYDITIRCDTTSTAAAEINNTGNVFVFIEVNGSSIFDNDGTTPL